MRIILLVLVLLAIPAGAQAQQSLESSVISSAFASKPWVKISGVDAADTKLQPALTIGWSFPTKWRTSSSIMYRTVNGRGPEWEFGISKSLW
jgi:hypothetical protein